MRSFVLSQHLLPQHFLSRCTGLLAKSKIRWMKRFAINTFIRAYDVNMTEAKLSNPEEYASFNDFFTRRLQPGARSINGHVSSPCDGTVSELGDIDDATVVQAKNITYSLDQLLATDQVEKYRNGSFITIYLSPRDYHRVHFPVACKLKRTRYIPGCLFSVNELTTNQVPGLFTKNERLVCELESDDEPLALIMVGAMIVAGIKTVWQTTPYPPSVFCEQNHFDSDQFTQGAELGHFELGSTVILLLKERVKWQISAGDSVELGQSLVNRLDDPH